jgi:hypothetical protein
MTIMSSSKKFTRIQISRFQIRREVTHNRPINFVQNIPNEIKLDNDTKVEIELSRPLKRLPPELTKNTACPLPSKSLHHIGEATCPSKLTSLPSHLDPWAFFRNRRESHTKSEDE